MSCRRKKNAARQAKSVGKNGYLIICRKVSERFVAGVGLQENGCAEPGRAVVVMPPKEKCGVSGKECGQKNGCLRKFRKVPERLLQAPGVRESECAGPESAGGVSSDRKNRICRGRTLSRRDNTAPCL